ncbi:hypothetical protein, partial [Phocaeicola coprocola]
MSGVASSLFYYVKNAKSSTPKNYHAKNTPKNRQKKKRQLLIIKQLAFILVLEAGLEPAQPQWPRDF